MLAVVGALNWAVILQYSIGAYAGWLYLRYFQRHENGSKGDPADHFAFPTLFPSWMNGPCEVRLPPVAPWKAKVERGMASRSSP